MLVLPHITLVELMNQSPVSSNQPKVSLSGFALHPNFLLNAKKAQREKLISVKINLIPFKITIDGADIVF